MNKEVVEKLKDKEFVGKIINMGTKEEVIKAFSDYNIEVSEKDLEEIGKIFNAVVSKISTLSDEELESASGGGGYLAKTTDATSQYIKNLGNVYGSDFMKENSEEIADTVVAGTIAGTAAIAGVGIYKMKQWLKEHKASRWFTVSVVF